MVRLLILDPSASLPLEIKLDILSRLTREDLLQSSSVSRTWRAAGRLDPRFIVHVCACTQKRKHAIVAREDTQDVSLDSFEHARRLKLRVALAYDTSGRTAGCGCAKPEHLATDDWLAFSKYVQPISERLVQLHIVTGPNMPQGGLFDFELPMLRHFRLEAERNIDTRPPSAVPTTMFGAGVPALRSVHLCDLVVPIAIPSFNPVTMLTLEFTDRCAESATSMPLEVFSNLRDVIIVGCMDIDSEEEDPVNWFSKIVWSPTLCSRLRSLSLIESWGTGWDHRSITLPPIVSLRYNGIPDDWTEHADSFLRTILPPVDEPLDVLLFTNFLKGLVVAQRPKSTDPNKPILRVLAMKDPQQTHNDSEQGLHEPLFQRLTSLTIQFDPFVRYDVAACHSMPFLRTLNLILDADDFEYPVYERDFEDEDCLELACLKHDHPGSHHTMPSLETISIIGFSTPQTLSSQIVWQLLRDMGVFMRIKPLSISTSLTLSLRGVIMQKDSKYDDFAQRCSVVTEDLNDVFPTEDIDKWTGPEWYNARL